MNDHDKVRQPRGLGAETLRAACFFLFIDDATTTADFTDRIRWNQAYYRLAQGF